MRSLLLAALGITAFSATMAVETPEANAVVYCAAGVVRAGCVVRPGVAPSEVLPGVLPGVLFGDPT